MKTTQSITTRLLPNLRMAGIKVRIRHSRYVSTGRGPVLFPMTIEAQEKYAGYILSHGGETSVDLLFPDGNTYSGVAKCSRSDMFNRLEGISIATHRALAQRKAMKELENFSHEDPILPPSWDKIELSSHSH